MEKKERAGRTYGRTTGYAVINGIAQRIRIAPGCLVKDGVQYLYCTPYDGAEKDAVVVPVSLTRKFKKDALELAAKLAKDASR